jgi:hypothetical protein
MKYIACSSENPSLAWTSASTRRRRCGGSSFAPVFLATLDSRPPGIFLEVPIVEVLVTSNSDQSPECRIEC